jgi:putative DNA methylase
VKEKYRTMTVPKKKLIEVALPLEAINIASAREKSIRHGHPSTLHLWWARRPLAAARAVIFAQMVDDPSSYPDLFPTAKKQEKERQRLFRIIEELVKWENTTNEKVLQAAREEIWQSWRRACAENADHPRAKELFDRHKLPAFHDPFAGGGALPLEAQRLGLESYASDLNPVAVLINKAMIEIPPKFAGNPPVNPEARNQTGYTGQWVGAQGLAEDVRYYGRWMRDEAEKSIGHLYPKIEITPEMVKERNDLRPYQGKKLTVIAWLWARTVKSPNPAYANVDVPLVTTFMLSTKIGKEVYIDPVIDGKNYRFVIKMGKPKDAEAAKYGTKLSRGANFKCVMSSTPIDESYIKEESMAGRMGTRMMAIVAKSDHGRVYLAPMPENETVATKMRPEWKPDQVMNRQTTNLVSGRGYGFFTWADLFTTRQLVTLTTFSDIVHEVWKKVKLDTLAAGLVEDIKPLASGGIGAQAYADAVAVYLGMAVSKETVFLVTQARWRAGENKSAPAFGRQALPMVWDYAEVNPFAGAGGDFTGVVNGICKTLENGPTIGLGFSSQSNACKQSISSSKLVSTDPPYYDNIGYADLSDYFYVWLRHSLKPIFPELFATLVVPKEDELIASFYRHGSKEKAEAFFLGGMTQAMHRLTEQAHPAFPVTIYYAFKQTEDNEEGTVSTGWDTFLDAVLCAGFTITGTWPMRTENSTRLVGMTTNSLASSIVLVCRPRPSNAPSATRREFVNALKSELPAALAHLQESNIAPVDLAQAAIGPGMSVYTRYSKVLDAEGKLVTVREALMLINQTLDEALAEQEGDFDADSRFALAWFEQQGFTEGVFGVADVLARAKNTSVAGMVHAGILESKHGKVRLYKPSELFEEWDPATDPRLTTWEIVHHLIRVLEAGGEGAAAELVKKLGAKAEPARELCYRLYTICERKKRAAEALSYNALVQSWPEIIRLSKEGGEAKPNQTDLFEAQED